MATDYQALLDAQQNPWLAYLAAQGYSPADLASLTPAPNAPPAALTPAQLDAVYGPGYTTQPLYHEAFPGYDGTLQSAIQYSDQQMNANKRAGLTNIGAALAGGVTGGLLSQAGAAANAANAANATGDVANGYGISPDFLAGGAGTGSAIADTTGLPSGIVGGGMGLGTADAGVVGASGGATGLAGGAGLPAIYGAAGVPGSAISTTGMPTGDVGGGMGLGSSDLAGQVGSGIGAGSNVASNLPSWLSGLAPYSGLIGAGLGLVDSALQPKSTTTTQGGTSQSTNTSSLQLPSQLTGAAGTALDRANQLLTQGQQFAPLPYLINHAADQLNTLGQNTAPTTSSFANGANINPYLDTEFNAAADATQNRLASEFANAGQFGSPQNTQARSQELQQLAAGIYGPGYENALGRQYGAQEAGVQRGLTQQDANLNRTLASAQTALPIGQYMQQSQQQQLNAPYTNLGQYIGQIGGLAPYFPGTYQQSQGTTQTGNVTQPLYNNPVTGAVGGAVLGNYFGNLFGSNSQQPQQGPSGYTGMQTPLNATWQQGGNMPAYSYL